MRKGVLFLLGIITGVLITSSFFWFNSMNEYVALKSDFRIENIGTLQAGTKLRYDGAMSEGFTRYVLYLNLKSSEDVEVIEDDRINLIIPYWLRPIDTLQNADN